MINEFWSGAAATGNKTQLTEKPKATKTTKTSNIKIISKQEQYEQYQQIAPQQPHSSITVANPNSIQITTVRNDVQAVNLKDISEAATAAHLLEQNPTLKPVLSKLPNQTSVNNLTSMVVNSDVSLAVNSLQYQDMPPTMLANPPIPKYQQALQQAITVQQQQLPHNSETGKVTFPKHVFSQARFLNKKQQQQMVSSDQQRVQCDICQKSLKTKKMLWAHKVAVHFGGNFPCEICGKKCITGAELRRHMTSHSSERKFVCQYCGLAYKRWSHLYQHLRVHEEEKNFRCDVCHVNFKVQSELKDHCFAEHASGIVVQCSVCKHKLQTPLAVYHHSMKHTGTRDFICEICGSNFKRKQHLVTHMKTHLTEKKNADGSTETYNCQACDDNFNLKMELKAHCESVHPLDSDETVICKTCKKHLNLSHSVYLHGLRHCGAREFQCDECEQLFKRKAHLLRHKLDRHPDEPKQRKKRTVQADSIICSLCRRSFKYKTALIKHMAGQHGILPKSDGSNNFPIMYKKAKKPHECNQCYKRFKSLHALEKHKLNKHSIEEINVVVQFTDEDLAETDGNQMNIVEIEGTETSATMVHDVPIKSPNMVMDHDGNDAPIDTLDTEKHELQDNGLEVTGLERVKQENCDLSRSDTGNEIESSHILTDDNTTEGHMLSNTALVGDLSAQETALENITRQVITVDQETGQIILMEATSMGTADDEQAKSEGNSDGCDQGKVVSIESDGGHSTNMQNDQGQIISVQTDPHQAITTFDGQGNVHSNSLASLTQNDLNVDELNDQHLQVSLGQIIGQDGVALTSVPIQSVQGLTAQNILDFNQASSEQIVVLLSALNSQNIQQM